MPRGLGSVAGRVAVVTGAASGIGRATAHALAKRGAVLALADIDAPGLERVADELSGRGTRLVATRVDVKKPDELSAFAERVERELGVAELLVNAAGVVVVAGFLETTLEDWSHVLDVNLRGPVHVCRAFLPAMVARGRGGHVVNVASAAVFATQSELAAYGTSKHGLAGLSQALADELSAHDIGVSLVCPGFVDTPILEHARVRGEDTEARRATARRVLQRVGRSPERVAERLVRAAERGEALVPVGIEAQALALLSRLAPHRAGAIFGLLRRLSSRT